MEKKLSYFSLSMPVYLARRLRQDVYQMAGQIEGTCFSIGGDIFLTAGHVVQTLQASDLVPVIGVFDSHGHAQQAVPVIEMEVLRCDLGILKVGAIHPPENDCVAHLPWAGRPLGQLDSVQSLGYAYGIHQIEGRTSIIQRAFRGYVVSDPVDFKPMGYSGDPFHVYEVSFSAPRGLSGSPLMTTSAHLKATGVVIGNSQSRMLILESEEVERGGGGRTLIQQYESLSLGIVVHAGEVFKSESQLLNKTLGEHLEGMKLLRRG